MTAPKYGERESLFSYGTSWKVQSGNSPEPCEGRWQAKGEERERGARCSNQEPKREQMKRPGN